MKLIKRFRIALQIMSLLCFSLVTGSVLISSGTSLFDSSVNARVALAAYVGVPLTLIAVLLNLFEE
jgi:hypothetical protein